MTGAGRARAVGRRLLAAAGTILFVLLLNFCLFRILPGDPARAGAGDPRLSAESRAAIRAQLGLDRPLPVQLGRYFLSLARGDLGTSYASNRPVAEILRRRLGRTVGLLLSAQAMALALGVLIGGVAAWKRGRAVDRAARAAALLAASLPSFWLGLLLLFAGSRWLGLPLGGVGTPGLDDLGFWARTGDLLRHMALPAFTLTVVFLGEYVLVARATLLETLGEDYVFAARARGLAPGAILRRHALPNAALPLVTLVALNLGFTVAGAVQVETVFSWPGIGSAVYEAVVQRDYPLLQGAFLLLAVAVVAANALADLAVALLDPRVGETA
jgi:peptide/nickel transport system permease protein